MSKGRKPTPNHLKRLRGTDQPIRMLPETTFEKLTEVSIPKILSTRRARQIFKNKSDELILHGVLTTFDIDQLTIYASSLDMLFQCQEKIESEGMFLHGENKQGEKTIIENPAMRLFRQLVDVVNKLGSDFGFNPVSRIKLKLNNEKPTKTGLEEFFS